VPIIAAGGRLTPEIFEPRRVGDRVILGAEDFGADDTSKTFGRRAEGHSLSFTIGRYGNEMAGAVPRVISGSLELPALFAPDKGVANL
jgi:hypothetical protein